MECPALYNLILMLIWLSRFKVSFLERPTKGQIAPLLLMDIESDSALYTILFISGLQSVTILAVRLIIRSIHLHHT